MKTMVTEEIKNSLTQRWIFTDINEIKIWVI